MIWKSQRHHEKVSNQEKDIEILILCMEWFGFNIYFKEEFKKSNEACGSTEKFWKDLY